MKTCILFFTLLFATLLQVSAQPTTCTETDECFDFIYRGPVVNNNETVTLNFSIKVNCNRDLSYAAFELPARAKASAYSPNIKVENTTNNPFYSIKFELNDGYKNGRTADFSYTITAAQFATLTTIRVQAKAAQTVGSVSFNPAGCNGGGPGQEPVCILPEDGFIFGLMGTTANMSGTTTVSFSVENTTNSPISMVMIEVPDAPQPIAATATAGFAADVDIDAGTITYLRTNTGTGNETVIFSFIIPTSAHELLPYYTLTAFTEPDADGLFGFGNTIFNTMTCTDIPLETFPVELSSFQGNTTRSGIELNWTTASEENTDQFEIQRSINGKDFRTVGRVKGAGNSAASLRYSYFDNNAVRGTNYYRINQVDLDGKSEFSNVIVLENTAPGQTNNLTIYPNPATGDNLTILVHHADFSDATYFVSITDISGRKVFEQQLSPAQNQELELSLGKLKMSSGIYLIKVQGNNVAETQKLLVK